MLDQRWSSQCAREGQPLTKSRQALSERMKARLNVPAGFPQGCAERYGRVNSSP
jgi:hypothetical protein